MRNITKGYEQRDRERNRPVGGEMSICQKFLAASCRRTKAPYSVV